MKAVSQTVWLRDVLPRADDNVRVKISFAKGAWYLYPSSTNECIEIQKLLPASYKQHEVLIVWP